MVVLAIMQYIGRAAKGSPYILFVLRELFVGTPIGRPQNPNRRNSHIQADGQWPSLQF